MTHFDRLRYGLGRLRGNIPQRPDRALSRRRRRARGAAIALITRPGNGTAAAHAAS